MHQLEIKCTSLILRSRKLYQTRYLWLIRFRHLDHITAINARWIYTDLRFFTTEVPDGVLFTVAAPLYLRYIYINIRPLIAFCCAVSSKQAMIYSRRLIMREYFIHSLQDHSWTSYRSVSHATLTSASYFMRTNTSINAKHSCQPCQNFTIQARSNMCLGLTIHQIACHDELTIHQMSPF